MDSRKSTDIRSILEHFLARDRVTDLFLSPGGVSYDQGSGIEFHGVTLEESALRTWVVQTITQLGKAYDAKVPYVDFIFPLGTIQIRGHAFFPPCSPQMEVSLRFLRTPPVDSGWTTDPYFPLLYDRFQNAQSILLCGSTGSGKTTLARILLSGLPEKNRIIALEDTPELHVAHPGFLSLRTREANADGFGEIRLKDLLRQTLRMRPDRIVLGECRGDEVLELLQVLNTGHAGSTATLHANSCREALKRIELLVLMHPRGGQMTIKAIRELILSGIQWIAHLKRDSEGRRRIAEVCAVAGIEGETLLLRPERLASREALVIG